MENDEYIMEYIKRIVVDSEHNSIYQAIRDIENDIHGCEHVIETRISQKFPLRDIINIHNADGIKDLMQIKSMIHSIRKIDNIDFPSFLPNIHLAKTSGDQWLIFNGHHSLLAYMAAGRKYLHEVPYLWICNEEGTFLNDEEILEFFGMHAGKMMAKDWRKYTLNWQAPKSAQLCDRIQNNMGELFDVLSHAFYF
jgi:hypothetical protein